MTLSPRRLVVVTTPLPRVCGGESGRSRMHTHGPIEFLYREKWLCGSTNAILGASDHRPMQRPRFGTIVRSSRVGKTESAGALGPAACLTHQRGGQPRHRLAPRHDEADEARG